MHPRRAQNIPIATLRAFVAISQFGSFSKAAEELGVTQPAISAQIKRLQRIVGGDLFVKKAVGVGHSELGRAVDRYARRILSLNDQLVAIAGHIPKRETLLFGIQSLFAPKLLAEVARRCQDSHVVNYRFVCSNVADLEEKLKSGYLDLVFMLAMTDSRRNLLAEWDEKIAWVRAASHFPVTEGAPIPFVGRQDGFMDSRVLDMLDDQDTPYRIVFSATDIGPIVAAVEAGMGVMLMPERLVPDTLVIARDRILPKLPQLRSGVFHKEGFDIARNKAAVDAFISAVQPAAARQRKARGVQRPNRPESPADHHSDTDTV
jgi:DNA-binding transcriptional LysR family regulator